jgi:hypothetical protein
VAGTLYKSYCLLMKTCCARNFTIPAVKLLKTCCGRNLHKSYCLLMKRCCARNFTQVLLSTNEDIRDAVAGTVRVIAQESVMNVRGSFFFHGVVKQALKLTTIRTMWINICWCSKRQYYWMRNQEQYAYTPFCSHRFQVWLLANVHHPCSSFSEAASRLNFQWPDWGGGGVPWVEGDRRLLHIIPHGPCRTELHGTPASFV